MDFWEALLHSLITTDEDYLSSRPALPKGIYLHKRADQSQDAEHKWEEEISRPVICFHLSVVWKGSLRKRINLSNVLNLQLMAVNTLMCNKTWCDSADAASKLGIFCPCLPERLSPRVELFRSQFRKTALSWFDSLHTGLKKSQLELCPESQETSFLVLVCHYFAIPPQPNNLPLWNLSFPLCKFWASCEILRPAVLRLFVYLSCPYFHREQIWTRHEIAKAARARVSKLFR